MSSDTMSSSYMHPCKQAGTPSLDQIKHYVSINHIEFHCPLKDF